jgi:RNA polymerase sigma-70 factor (ECF subfamily)
MVSIARIALLSSSRAQPVMRAAAHAAGVAENLSVEGAFRQYAPLVASLGLRMGAVDVDCEDFVQDVFVRALRGAARLREPAALKGWLITIAVNLARTRLRIRKLRLRLGLGAPASMVDVVDPSLSADERVLLAQLNAVLDRVPVNQRIAWTLRHVEGMPLDEVAVHCGCSLATAKRWIAAAQAALEEAMS